MLFCESLGISDKPSRYLIQRRPYPQEEERDVTGYRKGVYMYRPTVRYDDVYRSYVDDLFHATTLDRNQIIRAALFAAGHSNEFHSLIHSHLKDDVLPPSPSWSLDDHPLWMEQTPKYEREGKDVNANDPGTGKDEKANGAIGNGKIPIILKEKETHQPRRLTEAQRRNGEVFNRELHGGITIRIG